MNRSLPFPHHVAHGARLALALVLLLGTLGKEAARAALAVEPAEVFFNGVADQLLQQQLGRRLTEIQIAPTNQYRAAVHRILQVTANLYDATSTNDSPAVFRPLFATTSNGVFLAGFTNDHRVSTLAAWLDSNPHGLPLVIAARKGFPNFNEFTLRSDILMQRKLEVTRSSAAQGTRPNGTNVMYLLGVSNYFGVEAWNSISQPYPRAITVTVSNVTSLVLENGLGVQTNILTTLATGTNLYAGTWRGGEVQGFILPQSLNQVALPNSAYRFGLNAFDAITTNTYDPLVGFPLPYWVLTLSNRLTYLASEGNRIIDFVILDGAYTVDLHRDLVANPNPYQNIPGTSANLIQLWNTNRTSPSAPTEGIKQQLRLSTDSFFTTVSDWRDYGLTGIATENDKRSSVESFRNFLGLGPQTTVPFTTNNTLAMQAPFNPAAKLVVLTTWQANDPLVHYHLADLTVSPTNTNRQYYLPSAPASNVWPASLGMLNRRYSPWGGNPNLEWSEDLSSVDYRIKDPGVYNSDNWNFPTNTPLSASWLGRVHRGTPWQTLYLKAGAAPLDEWLEVADDVRSHPTNDWRLVAWLAARLNTNDVRALTSINTTNAATWAATLTGLTVLSNTLSDPVIGDLPEFETSIITTHALQISTLVAALNRARAAQPGQYFADVSAFLTVRELSIASPWLNLSNADLARGGLTDEAYEALPAQLLALVRADPVVTVTRTGADLRLHFRAFDGYAWRVESSADLSAWTTWSEPHYASNGVFTLTVPASASPQFFRAVLP